MAKGVEQVLHLPNAPIVEALIDFRVNPPGDTTAESLKPLQALLADRYPTFAAAKRLHAHIEVKDGQAAQQTFTETQQGFRAESRDKLYVLQAHTDGFTVSRLKPYEHWERLRDEAKALWDSYRRVLSPLSVTRAAVRYINRIELPLGVDFDDYLAAAPKIPEPLPQMVGSFLTRVVIPYEATGIQMIITQALEGFTPGAKAVPVILDVDVSLEKTFEMDDSGYWKILEELRHIKNRAFFGSLTDKALELFK